MDYKYIKLVNNLKTLMHVNEFSVVVEDFSNPTYTDINNPVVSEEPLSLEKFKIERGVSIRLDGTYITLIITAVSDTTCYKFDIDYRSI